VRAMLTRGAVTVFGNQSPLQDQSHLTKTSEVLLREVFGMQVPCLRDVRNAVKSYENLGGLSFG